MTEAEISNFSSIGGMTLKTMQEQMTLTTTLSFVRDESFLFHHTSELGFVSFMKEYHTGDINISFTYVDGLKIPDISEDSFGQFLLFVHNQTKHVKTIYENRECFPGESLELSWDGIDDSGKQWFDENVKFFMLQDIMKFKTFIKQDFYFLKTSEVLRAVRFKKRYDITKDIEAAKLYSAPNPWCHVESDGKFIYTDGRTKQWEIPENYWMKRHSKSDPTNIYYITAGNVTSRENPEHRLIPRCNAEISSALLAKLASQRAIRAQKEAAALADAQRKRNERAQEEIRNASSAKMISGLRYLTRRAKERAEQHSRRINNVMENARVADQSHVEAARALELAARQAREANPNRERRLAGLKAVEERAAAIYLAEVKLEEEKARVASENAAIEVAKELERAKISSAIQDLADSAGNSISDRITADSAIGKDHDDEIKQADIDAVAAAAAATNQEVIEDRIIEEVVGGIVDQNDEIIRAIENHKNQWCREGDQFRTEIGELTDELPLGYYTNFEQDGATLYAFIRGGKLEVADNISEVPENYLRIMTCGKTWCENTQEDGTRYYTSSSGEQSISLPIGYYSMVFDRSSGKNYYIKDIGPPEWQPPSGRLQISACGITWCKTDENKYRPSSGEVQEMMPSGYYYRHGTDENPKYDYMNNSGELKTSNSIPQHRKLLENCVDIGAKSRFGLPNAELARRFKLKHVVMKS